MSNWRTEGDVLNKDEKTINIIERAKKEKERQREKGKKKKEKERERPSG
jgi:hypothetical protein